MHPPGGEPPLTLADVTVTWKGRDELGREVERTATGRQLAHLLGTVAERFPCSDASFGSQADNTGQWIYKLRGLSYLVFPDAGVSIHENDARALVSDVLAQAAAEIAADQLVDEEWPARYTVHVKRGAGVAK
jgi:hypothetical protein